MFCSSCGAHLDDNAAFCMQCGAKVNGTTNNVPESPKMKFVAAKCTSCGAGLSVNPEMEAAICPFCKTPYIVEKAIQNFKITNNYIETQINIEGVSADNLVSMAENALKAGKYSEAFDYANRALETEPANTEAWITKIKVLGYDIEGDRSSEIATYVETALSNSVTDLEEVKLYEAVIDVSKIHIQEAIKLLENNTDRIKKQLADRRDKRDIAAMDSGYVARTTQITNEAIEYRQLIPQEILTENDEIKRAVASLAEKYEEYCTALSNRYSLYGMQLPSKIVTIKQENLNKLLPHTSTEKTKNAVTGKSLFSKWFN